MCTSATMAVNGVSLSARLRQLAAESPLVPAVTCGDVTLTRAQLDQRGRRLAANLSAAGVGVGDYVSLVLPNDTIAVVATIACWFVGAIPQPLSPKLPAREIRDIVDLIRPKAVIGYDDELPGRPAVVAPDPEIGMPVPELAEVTSPAWKASTSGGSTGRPKVIVAAQPATCDAVDGLADLFGIDEQTTALVTAPVSHNGPFVAALTTVVRGGHVVVMPRFDAAETLRLIERHAITWVYAVPTMMSRILKLPSEHREAYDVSSVTTWMHMAAPCPPSVKETFIRWLGARTVRELYGGTEGQAITIINGDEWLEHRNSVGRAVLGEIEIRDDAGMELPVGAVGRVWMRRGTDEPAPYFYVGATPVSAAGGWETLGDMGWMDDDGYLYLADRDTDMIVVGGSNVYPAEVEAALLDHPAVDDACVIGLPDEDLGHVPHALVRTVVATTATDLTAFLRLRLAAYKQPRSYEFVDEPLRDEAGKVRRGAIRAARLAPGVPGRNASD